MYGITGIVQNKQLFKTVNDINLHFIDLTINKKYKQG